ncbi:MAG: hypothetical protein ABL309_12900 [Phycisphaerales bacterium]
MPDEPIPSELPWYLAEVIEVAQEKAVQCQRRGCGRRVYRAVHIVIWANGRIETWGGDCFQDRLAKNALPEQLKPRWSVGGGGRRLTDEERTMLDTNREELIQWFEEQWNIERLRQEEEAKTAAELAEKLEAEREARIREQLAKDANDIAYRKSGSLRPASQFAKVYPQRQSHSIREPKDPRYFEIKKQLETAWRNSGQSLTGDYQQRIFIENAIARYRRRYLDA